MRNQIATLIFIILFGQANLLYADAVKLGTETQLFVDDVRIAKTSGVERHINPGRKLPHPVLEPENPWEGNRVYTGSVHYDPATKGFVMWYFSFPAKYRRYCVNYATSTDGIHWVKPKLGLHSFQNSKDNNIVLEDLDSPSVIVDPADPDPKRRYKIIGKRKGGFFMECSPDGIHWSPFQPKWLFPLKGDTTTLTRSPYSGEYLAFHKERKKIRGHVRRSVMLSFSKDLLTWSKPRLVLAADEIDDAWVKKPIQCTQFYRMSAFSYGGQFLGIANTFRRTEKLDSVVSNQSSDEGPIHGQLIHSRDGHTWSRFEDRTPIIPNGPAKYDAGCILFAINTPVIYNDEVWIYYTGITTGHGGKLPEKRITIGRAAWRLDGFVSLDAGQENGTVETVMIEPVGNRLVVNADASKGRVAVEVLDADGKTLPGYAADDCIALKSDAVRHAVKWKDHDSLPTDRPIRLRFQLKNASLYSYRVKSGD